MNHKEIEFGWICEVTEKEVDQLFTDHDKEGCYNSCSHCNPRFTTIADSLRDLYEKRRKEEENERL